jgi:hypothetical protein
MHSRLTVTDYGMLSHHFGNVFVFVFLGRAQADYQALPRPQTSEVVKTTDEVTALRFPAIRQLFFLLFLPVLPGWRRLPGARGPHVGSVFVLCTSKVPVKPVKQVN